MQDKIKSKIKNKTLIETRRRELINAALELFVKKGFHQTSVREIAKEFGMSMGALYDYIRTKNDILYLVCDHIHSNASNKLRESLVSNKSGLEILKNSIKEYFIIIDKNQNYILLLYQETKNLSRYSRKYIFNAEQQLTSLFEDMLKQCIKEKSVSINASTTNLVAHNIMVAGHMWAFRRWAIHKDFTINKYIKAQTELILKGIT